MLEFSHILSFTEVTMQVFGAFVILLAFAFFSFALYAANQAPKWSGKPRRTSRCRNVCAIWMAIDVFCGALSFAFMVSRSNLLFRSRIWACVGCSWSGWPLFAS